MYKSGNYYAHKFLISNEPKIFYSKEKNKTAAWIDICDQKKAYEEERARQKYNFKCLADKMMEQQEKAVGYKCMESYNGGLLHLRTFYDRDIQEITALDVQNLLDDMARQKYSFSQISKTKTVFGLVIKYAILYERLPINNYMSVVKVPKNAPKGKITAPPDFVIDTIIKSAYTTKFGLWATSLLCTGFRRGELDAVQRKDVDFKNMVIPLYRSVEFIHNQPHLKDVPKTESGIRKQPILEIYKPYLEKICEGLAPEDFLFGGDKPLTETQIKKRWDRYCQEIGYSFKGHQLRHAYALLLYRAGYDPKTMQHLLGHADFKTTMNIYTDFSKEVESERMRALNSYMAERFLSSPNKKYV